MGLGEGIEEDQGIVLPGGLLIVGAQPGEHTAVLHVVAEEGDVVAGLKDIAFLPGVDAATDGFLLVEIPVQVEIGVVHRGLHHGIVDFGEGEETTSVYLPKNDNWYLGSRLYHGGQFVDVSIKATDKMPYFVKAGSVIPTGEEKTVFTVYPVENGRFESRFFSDITDHVKCY